MFVFYNPNPENNLVGDCVIRAISIATQRDWDSVYADICVQGYKMKDMPSSNAVWGAFLSDHGFKRYIIPNSCPNCYTVADFCEDNPEGYYILATGTHVVTVIEGNHFDTWDSSKEVPTYYWQKGV